MHHSVGQARQLTDLIQIGDAVLPEQFAPMIVLDVAIHRLFAMVGLTRNFRRQIALQIEGDDLPFVGDRAGEIVDVASGGEEVSLVLDLVDVFADRGITDAQEDGQIQLGP